MNKTIQTLAETYLEGGLDSIVLYYDFSSQETGVVGSGSEFTGVFKNQSFVSSGYNSGIVLNTASTSESEALSKLTGSFFLNDKSGVNLTYSNISFEDFSGISFMSPDNDESQITFLFSFEKVSSKNGVLFGNLNKFNYTDANNNFNYGKGFNIGVNDRNQLFFQGIDSLIGEYLLTANNLELANRNICSATISAYSVEFSLYNLLEDSFLSQNLITNSKILNNDWGENFLIGGSPTYLREGETFSGYLDEFMIISGANPSSDLKSLSSGFLATGIETTGSFIDEFITGYDIQTLVPVGVTGLGLTELGSGQVKQISDLIEITLVEDPVPFSINDGERFLTGYILDNNSGSFLEETSFLIPYTGNYQDYIPTGNGAFDTLGLENSGNIVNAFTLQSSKKVETIQAYPIYEVVPLTGVLLEEPTGYQKTYNKNFIEKTSSTIGSLEFIDSSIELYKHDYIHYLDKRI